MASINFDYSKFSPGILPIGRLEHLVRAATDKNDAAAHWDRYVYETRYTFPNEGEFRIFPLVEHFLGKDAKTATANIWFDEARKWSVERNKKLKSEQQKIESAFADQEISLIWTKGTALANRIYPKHHLRPSSDLDAICHWDGLDKIVSFAETQNWESKLGRVVRKRKNRYSGTEMSWDISPDVALDVSWMPRLSFACDPFMIDWICARAPQNRTSYAHPTWLLLEAIEHGLSANVVSPLRWVVDAIWIINECESDIDWDLIVEVTKRYRLHSVMYLGMSTIAQFCDKIPEHIVDQLSAGANDGILKDEIYARAGIPNLAISYRVARRYNLAIRAPTEIYKNNIVTPWGFEQKQSVRLRGRVAARNIHARLIWPWARILYK